MTAVLMGISAFYLAGGARVEVFRAVFDRGRSSGRGLYLAGERPLCISEKGTRGWCLGIVPDGRDRRPGGERTFYVMSSQSW